MVGQNIATFHPKSTSNSDFDKGGCVIQVEWTKALCDNCQTMLYVIVYISQGSISDIYVVDSCV